MTAEKHQNLGASDYLTSILEQHGKTGCMSRFNCKDRR